MIAAARVFAGLAIAGALASLSTGAPFRVALQWGAMAAAAVGALLTVAQAVRALKAGSWRDWSLQAIALVLSVLVGLPGLPTLTGLKPSPAAGETTALPPATATLPIPAAEVPSAPIDVLPAMEASQRRDLIESTAAARTRLAAERWSWDARVKALGADPQAAFAFVRDHVGWDAYEGVLRGAVGAFLARRGNAWDRALLLQAMLQAHGTETRLARARPDPAAAARLFARVFEPVVAAPGDAVADAPAPHPLLSRLRARASRDYGVVRAALGDLPSGDPHAADTARASLADHVWVQARVNDQWIDLDPSLPGASFGAALVPARSTSAVPPADAYQRVTFRVHARVEHDGQSTDATVLEVERPAADLVDRQIFLTHAAGAGGVASGFGAMLARVGGERWTPLLIVDGETIRGDAVPYGATDDAGTFFGGDDTRLVGEWLEVTVTLPGGRADTSRRLLASSAHGPARRSLDAKAVHSIWLSAGRHNLLAYAQATETLALALRPGPGGTIREPEESEDGLWALGVASFPFMVWSDHVVVPSLNADRGVRVYADSPRIVLVSRRQDSRDPQRGVTEYDLLRDRVFSIAATPDKQRDAVEKRVWFGMLEGALEHELAAGAVASAGGSAEDLLSTSALLGERGVERLGQEDTERAATVAGDDARADRLRADLAASAAVIVPRPEEGASARGWWTVAADGTTRAVIDDGLGGSSYSLGGGGPGGWYRPGSTPGGTWRIDPRTGADVGRMRWDGTWERVGARGAAARGGGNEYATLLVAIAIANILIWSVVAFEIMYYVEQGAGVLSALPAESTE